LSEHKKTMIIVETTFPDKNLAKKLASLLLERNICACIHISQIESFYSWNNNIETTNEVLLRIKTAKHLFNELSEIIKKNHPYDVAEIIATEIINIEDKYKNWLKTSLKS